MRGAALLGRVLLAAWLPVVPSPPLAAQESQDVARLTGEIGIEPEPGSLLASTARLSVEQLPLAEALVQLAERSRVQIAFSPSLLPPDRVVDCACATKNVARTLDELLARTDLGYVELGSQVIVVPRAMRESPLDAIVGGQAGPEVVVAAADAPFDAQAPGETADSLVYLDETARRLMEGARAARDSALSEIESYTATIRERNSVEFSMLVRDRPIWRQESATRVRWSRNEPTVIRVLGSRMEIGGQRFRPSRPEGVAARFAADPLRDPFGLFVLSGMGAHAEESWFVPSVTPLDDDAERFYQFRSGDTISVHFPGGSVQAVSVTVHPRAQQLGLVFAVLWIEPETFGVVRTIYRPARPIDSEVSFRKGNDSLLDIDLIYQGKALGDIEAPSPPRPGLSGRILNYALNAALSSARMEIGVPVAVVDYSMWNFRHWLPRRANFAHYAIGGDEWDTGDSDRVMMQMFHDWDFEIEDVSTGSGDPRESASATGELVRSWREEGDTVVVKDGSQPDSGTVVIAPREWRALGVSDVLPPSIWEERESGLYGSVIDEAGEVLDSIGIARGADNPEGAETDQDISPWYLEAPILTPRLMRYNPIEGLSVGSRLVHDFPWGRAALTVRTGTRRGEPSVDLATEYGRTGPRVRLSLYHTLRETGGTATAHRPPRWAYVADPSDYYVVRGAAIQFLPARSERSWTSLSLFSETNTTLGGDARRRHGVELYWRPWWGGLTGRRVSGGADLSLRGLVGDYPNVRLSVTGMLVIPLPANLSMAVEAGGARVDGDPAPEETWRLGSSGDWLRGYPQPVLSGRQVWRSRVELQRKVSLVALSVFHDWASVDRRSLQSAGFGVSVFNGFLRVDLARPLAPWYQEGTPVPGRPRAGIDWAHQPEWQWHLRALAPF